MKGDVDATDAYWGRERLGEAILESLAAAGRNLDALTLDDLAAFDHFHPGGKQATRRLARLARLAGLAAGTRVLDVGGGLGRPARTLAVEFDCEVMIVDLTASYLAAADMLNRRLGVERRVMCRVGDALDLPVAEGSFDVVWTQNSGMAIAAKERLYAGFHRALRPGGRLVLQEPMQGPVEPLLFPEMWSRDGGGSHLRTPEAMRTAIEAAGFSLRAWDDVTADTLGPAPGEGPPPPSIQYLVMGDALPQIMATSRRNRTEGRMVIVHAVFDRDGR